MLLFTFSIRKQQSSRGSYFLSRTISNNLETFIDDVGIVAAMARLSPTLALQAITCSSYTTTVQNPSKIDCD
jgi:hypothetical protein